MNAMQKIAENARKTCQDVASAVDGDGYSMPSPCMSVCKMDAERVFCQGCLRTIDEITRWSRMADSDKLAVWHLIAQRAEQRPSTP